MPASKSSVRVSRGSNTITFKGPIANDVFNAMAGRPKQPTQAQLEKQLADFNAKHPVGTPVTYTEVKEIPSTARQTKTRSVAWIMGGHSVMVMVEGISGGVCVEHITPAQA